MAFELVSFPMDSRNELVNVETAEFPDNGIWLTFDHSGPTKIIFAGPNPFADEPEVIEVHKLFFPRPLNSKEYEHVKKQPVIDFIGAETLVESIEPGNQHTIAYTDEEGCKRAVLICNLGSAVPDYESDQDL